MNVKLDNGQITFTWNKAHIAQNTKIGHDNGLEIQLYWPTFKIKNYKENEKFSFQRMHKEFYFGAPTNFRIVYEKGYFGIGGNLLGFGIAMDYLKTFKNE